MLKDPLFRNTIDVGWHTLLALQSTIVEWGEDREIDFIEGLTRGAKGHGDTVFRVTIEELEDGE